MAINRIEYQGPDKNYNSYIDGTLRQANDPGVGVGSGYADYDFLIQELEHLLLGSKNLYDACSSEMKDFTLVLDTSDQTLIESHKMSYPDDETPESISFMEYIYNYSVSLATSSQYVNKYYENKVRGVNGTNALDVAHIARIIYSEAKRIESFLNKYIGDIDDPSEFRVLETLQDWTQNAKNLLSKFRETFTTKRVAQIPAQEMAQLNEARAKEFQGLFQSKLNIINSSISDLISQTYKDWDLVADLFYDKILGPSLSFNLKVSRNINQIDASTAPTLHAEAQMTTAGLRAQLEAALADQIKRNNLFYEYLDRIYKNLVQRDSYVYYIDQLSNLGTKLSNSFITQTYEDTSTITNNRLLLGDQLALTYDTNASSNHNNLTNRDDSEAHPQYMLRTGDLLTGRLEIFGQLQLNGQDLTPIFGVGLAGDAVVRSASIDWTGVSPNELATAINEDVPVNLEISNVRPVPGDRIEYTIKFDIQNASVQGYEFEIIEL